MYQSKYEMFNLFLEIGVLCMGKFLLVTLSVHVCIASCILSSSPSLVSF